MKITIIQFYAEYKLNGKMILVFINVLSDQPMHGKYLKEKNKKVCRLTTNQIIREVCADITCSIKIHTWQNTNCLILDLK